MRRRVRIFLSVTAVLGFASGSGLAAETARDACGLLTRAEVQAIQGGKLRQAKPSRQNDGALSVSQCFYDIEPFVKSVSLAMTRSEGANADASTVKARWDRLFHSAARAEAEKESREEAEKGGDLRPVPGIGQEAFWEPSRVGGALYVFQKGAFIRISVGGSEADAARLERTKKLARLIVKRI